MKMAVFIRNAARKGAVALVVALSSLVSTSFASPVISYTASNSGENEWVYQYTGSNPAPSDPIAEFTIWFDQAQYTNLSVIGSPAGWDSIVIQRDVGFANLNTGTPGAQPFELDVYEFSWSLIPKLLQGHI